MIDPHEGPVLLRATDIARAYAGVHALRSASFELLAGEVHALIGENGAGKSTLIKVMTGAVTPDRGDLEVGGETVIDNSPRRALALGIAAIYQQPALFPDLSVAENIALGREGPAKFRRIDWKQRRTQAAELLARVGARIDPDATPAELSMPQQQMVEVARALGADAKILILDEPTACLAETEAQNLFNVIRQLRGEGVGLIYISHRLEELPTIADRVTVLRDGTTIDTRLMSEVDRPELIRLMVGRELSAVFPKVEVAPGGTVLELRGFTCAAAGVSDVNLTVHAGEIVGLAGLVGAGRTELARTIFGLTPSDGGQILLHGLPVRIRSPGEAIKRGIAYLPEDRRHHGVVLDLPISANMSLASLDSLSTTMGIDFARERAMASDYTVRLGIKTRSIFTPAAELSGGNQQKVALSRWLATSPRVLILDEPTQGIDVGAKAEIHALMTELAARGVAILMISSELPEIMGMSDRMVVMCGGKVAAEWERGAVTQEQIMEAAFGTGGPPAVAATMAAVTERFSAER
jgi:rhamnose transport system ATP-binding protein